MTRLIMRKNPAIQKSRTALYMDRSMHIMLDEMAEKNDSSLNAVTIHLIELGFKAALEIEALAATDAAPNQNPATKTRKSRAKKLA
jgi:hypothetical protein